MRRIWLNVLLIAALMLVSAAPVMAQDGTDSPAGGPTIYVPFASSSPGSTDAAKDQLVNTNGPTKVYIVTMELAPAVAYRGGVNGFRATAPAAGGKIDASSADVASYQAMLVQEHQSAMAAVGGSADQIIHNYTVALNGFAAPLTAAQAKAMAAQPGVTLVLEDQLRHKTTDATPGFLGLSGRSGVWAKGITGEDVVVGVIDTGIWPEHPSFADNGSYGPSPIPPVPCEFGNTAHNPNDAPFTCNNKLLGAREVLDTYKANTGLTAEEYDSARDDDGHGTHTASTAAGNAHVRASIFGIPRGYISGVAPRARVIAYKGLGELGGYTSDLVAAIDYAVGDGVDVINYSIGGGPSVTGGDDIAYLYAADAGVFVAASAGNDGPDPGTVGGPASVPWLTAVAASTHNRTFIAEIKISGPGRPPQGVWGASVTPGVRNFRLVDAQGIEDSNHDTSGMCLNPFPEGTFQARDAVLCNQYDFGIPRTDRVANVAAAGGGAVLFHNSPAVSMTPTDNFPLPTVTMLNNVGQALKDYLVAHPGHVKISFDTGVPRYAGQDPRVKADVMASFSSRGPNVVAPDIIKPDITAPGISILAGASPIHVGTAAQGQLFQAIMGTSMSSPQMAGVYALIKQAHPEWTAAMAKSAVMTTAYQGVVKQDGSTPADPFDMGAGRVNPGGYTQCNAQAAEGAAVDSVDAVDEADCHMATADASAAASAADTADTADAAEVDAATGHPGGYPGGRPNKGGLFDPGLVYDAGFYDYLGFLCDAGPEVFADPAATCAFLEANGIPTKAINLNLASIGVSRVTGSQTVTRTVVSVASDDATTTREYRVSVSAPQGYKVQVSPWILRLKPGEAATYAVTFTNVNAPIGEWRFGSLRWRDRSGTYLVRSPIAVRGALFDAPAEISGSGETGSASFPVKFGYTGTYQAAAHGLVPATVTTDNVVQDPDQAFDPNDGFSDAHTFNLSGAAFFRIAIPPEATEADADLDVYVFDPNGDLVAASTNGGTDEQVDIELPADGTWTVYVHGWAAPGGNSDYNMYSWIVPLATGGSLTINSAPTSATSGAVGTVQVGWSGATAGQWYLGSVTHTGPSGNLGQTLVNVDNR